MNTKFVASSLIALAAVASSAAFAGEYDASSQPERLITSQLSRAEVQADYFKAVKEGTLPAVGEGAVAAVKATSSTLSRAEVSAQTAQWARTHGAVNFGLL